MTLEEAIRHAEEKAKCGGRCGEEHAQLAGWLKELQERRAAQPEKRTEEHTESHACDSISRRAAIEIVDRYNKSHMMLMRKPMLGAASITIELEDLPTIEPERKTGTWIPQDHNRRNGYVTTTVYYYPKCSECGHSGNYGMSYCPNCGAWMGGEQDEAD